MLIAAQILCNYKLKVPFELLQLKKEKKLDKIGKTFLRGQNEVTSTAILCEVLRKFLMFNLKFRNNNMREIIRSGKSKMSLEKGWINFHSTKVLIAVNFIYHITNRILGLKVLSKTFFHNHPKVKRQLTKCALREMNQLLWYEKKVVSVCDKHII